MKSRQMACQAQIWSYFVQSKKSTTPISVNHVTKKLGQHSFVLMCLNGFEIVFFFSMVSGSFSWTNPPASTKSKICFFWCIYPCHPVPTYWGQTLSICEDPPRGLDFVEAESWYNKKKRTKQMGLEAWISHVCDFVEAPPF